MYVAAAFTLAAGAVVLALRDEPKQALAAEPAALATQEAAVRPTHPPEPLPGPERPRTEPAPEPEPEPDGPGSEPPEPASLKPEPEPRPQPEPRPEARSQSQPEPRPQIGPEEKKPEAEPEPGPGRVRSAGRSPDPQPAPETKEEPRREPARRTESQRTEPQRAEPEAAETGAGSAPVVRAGRSRPPAEEPRRPGLPAGVEMTLSVSALGLHDVPVAESASRRALDDGVIHLPDTSLPWDGGGDRNVYLVGHRLGYPGTGSHRIFYRLDELRAGDEIVIKDRLGRRYEYRVTGSLVVGPRDSWVKDPVPGRDVLSLQTCTPIPTFERRLIVRANRV